MTKNYILPYYSCFFLQCFFPYFIGDGDSCTVDEDGDGYPNVPLEVCTELSVEQKMNITYCTPVRINVHHAITVNVLDPS